MKKVLTSLVCIIFLILSFAIFNNAKAAYYTINSNTTIKGYLAVEGAILADHNEIMFSSASPVDPIIDLGKGDSKIREMGDLYITSDDNIHLGSSTYAYGAVLIQTPAEIAARSSAATGKLRAGVVEANLIGGNVVGTLTGDVTGNLTGDVTGNVTGNVTGDVTGDITGHSSADLALTGGTMEGNIDMDGNSLIGVEDLYANTLNVESNAIFADIYANNIYPNVGTDIGSSDNAWDNGYFHNLYASDGINIGDSYFTVDGSGNVSTIGDLDVGSTIHAGEGLFVANSSGISLGDNFSVDADGNIYSAGGMEIYDATYLDDILSVGGLASLNGGIRVHNGDFLVDVYGLVTAPSYNGLILSTNVDGFSVTGGTLARTLTLTDNNVTLNQSLSTIDSPTFNILTATTLTDGTAVLSTGDYSSTGTINAGNTTVTNLINTGASDLRGDIYNGSGGNVSVNDDLRVSGMSNLIGNVGIGANATSVPLYVTTNPASTNTVVEVARLERTTSGTAAAGIGAAQDYYLENDAGNSIQAARISSSLTTVTGGAEVSKLSFYTKAAGSGTLVETMSVAGGSQTFFGSVNSPQSSAYAQCSDNSGTNTIAFWANNGPMTSATNSIGFKSTPNIAALTSSVTLTNLSSYQANGGSVLAYSTGNVAVTNVTGYEMLQLGVAKYGTGTNSITNYYQFKGIATSFSNVTVANAYGLYLGNISGASTLNYSIFTNAGLVHLGDNVDIAAGKSLGVGATPLAPLHVSTNPASTNTIVEVARLERTTSGTASAGIGAAQDYYLENDAGNSIQAARISSSLTTVTGGAEVSKLSFWTKDASSGTLNENMQLLGSGQLYVGGMNNTGSGQIAVGINNSAFDNSFIALNSTTISRTNLYGYTATPIINSISSYDNISLSNVASFISAPMLWNMGSKDISITNLISYQVNLSLAKISSGVFNITNLYHFKSENLNAGGSTIANAYGIYLGNISGASTLNYSIYTNAGKVHFGDNVEIANTKTLYGSDTANGIGTLFGTSNATTTNSYIRVGTATTTHTIGNGNSLLVTGALEVDGQGYFDGNVDALNGLDVSGAALTATGAVDFSGATGMRIPQGAGLAAAGNCAAAGDVGKVYYANTTAGDMTSGYGYMCSNDSDHNGATGDYAWQVINQTVSSGSDCGKQVVDVDGNYYNTVQIGTQCWMADNMKTTHYPDGSAITRGPVGATWDGTDHAYYAYPPSTTNIAEETLANITAYHLGFVYQWNAAMKSSVVEGSQGICPTGWHVPTDAQQNTLDQYLKDNGQTCDPARNGAWDCSGSGTKLKSGGASGFNGPLSGYRGPTGGFNGRASYAYFWSSTVSGGEALARLLDLANATVFRYLTLNTNGLSVRCLKD